MSLDNMSLFRASPNYGIFYLNLFVLSLKILKKVFAKHLFGRANLFIFFHKFSFKHKFIENIDYTNILIDTNLNNKIYILLK